MARLTKDNKLKYWHWIFHEMLYPFAFLVAAYFALLSFGVHEPFRETFAAPDSLLLAGLVFLGLFSDLKGDRSPSFGGIPAQALPNAMHLVSLGLLFAYLVMKVKLLLRVPSPEQDGTFKGAFLIFQPRENLGCALLVLIIVTFLICGNIKLKSLLLK